MTEDELEALRAAAEEHRNALLNLTETVIREIESRGMTFQDEPWWSEFCAFASKFKDWNYGELMGR